jgi:hypothetical protein
MGLSGPCGQQSPCDRALPNHPTGLNRSEPAIHWRPLLAVTVNSRASRTADFDRRSLRIESQVPGAALYSHWRPEAGGSGRQLPSWLKPIAVILGTPVIKLTFKHLG